MYTVYVLRDNRGKLYKGMSGDLQRRLREHRRGTTRTTSQMGELTVVHTENYGNVGEARAREVYLKSAAGRRYLKKILGA